MAALESDCAGALAAGARDAARRHLVALLELADRLAVTLVDACLRELLVAFTGRERQIAARLEQDFLEALQIGRCVVEVASGFVRSADEAFAAFYATSAEHLVGLPIGRLLPEDAYAALLEAAAARDPGLAARGSARTATLAREPLALELMAYFAAGERTQLTLLAINVSQREHEVQQRRLLSAAVEASDEMIVVTDAAYRVVYVNAAFCRRSGYSADESLGRQLGFLQGGSEPGPEVLEAVHRSLEAGRTARAELLTYSKDGRPFWIELSMVPIRDEAGAVTNWVAVARDISERRSSEQAIARLAMEDHLTGLPNRRAAEARLQMEWNRARRDRGAFAVALADIDRFKLVNDQYGHRTGDEVLRHVADTLAANLRGGDWVARWGGEEFLICFHDLDARGALVAGERLRGAIRAAPFRAPGLTLPVTVSMGIGVYEPGVEQLDQMITGADALLYEAKQSGRDKVLCVGFAEGRRGSVIWEGSQVQSALHESRIVAVFQPVVDLRSGRRVGEEVYARIAARDRSLIPAHSFIHAAEALHLVGQIDAAIARDTLDRAAAQRAGRDAAASAASGGEAPSVWFINLSSQFLTRGDHVEALLEYARSLGLLSGAGRCPLVIEIAERQSGDLANLESCLRPLIDAGFSLSIDDFGSGYSSFQHLADLPVRYLKVEGWMVARSVGDPRIRRLVESIVNTAHRFDLITVAECVENSQTAQILGDLGVDWGQGYFFGRPQPGETR